MMHATWYQASIKDDPRRQLPEVQPMRTRGLAGESPLRERGGRLEEIGFTWRFVATDQGDVLMKLRYWEEMWDWWYRELKE